MQPSPSTTRRRHPADAAFSEWIAADGWRLRRMELPAVGRPRGALLFAGGRGDFIEKNMEPALHWQARGWQVTMFDWRGQGGSAGTIRRGHLLSLDPLVTDAADLAAGWRAGTAGPHVVIGHSMGGHVLLRMLIERPLPVAAAVLVAPMICVNTHPLPVPLARLVARIAAMLVPELPMPGRSPIERQRFLTACQDRFADEAWWKAREPTYDLGPPTWGWLDAALRSSARLTDDALARVEIPTLIIGADHDRLVSAAAIRRAAAALPRADLHMFPDAAHEILREADPVREAALAAIDSFLDRVAA